MAEKNYKIESLQCSVLFQKSMELYLIHCWWVYCVTAFVYELLAAEER